MEKIFFDGWYLLSPGENPVIPWQLIIARLIFSMLCMSVITSMSYSDSRLRTLLENMKIDTSEESYVKYAVVSFSIIMAILRDIININEEISLAMIIVPVLSIVLVLVVITNKIKLSYIPFFYGLCIICISSIPSWDLKTLVFIAPTALGLILGYIIGQLDSKRKQQLSI